MTRSGPVSSVLDMVGKTPMVRLNRVVPAGSASVYAKLESFNPMSSVKDRIAKSMLEDAERKGLVTADTTVVEPTSGNTGIGLAMVCAVKGYRLILTMPDTMSPERRKLMSALGAELVLTPGADGMQGAVEKAREIASSTPDSFMPLQFENKANPAIHRKTTAKEIIRALERVDVFVAGVGSGGTVTGVGKALKRKSPQVKVIAVEPAEAPLLSEGRSGNHRIQGLGPGFVPKVLDRSVIDEIVTVSYEDARHMTRELARREGLLVGVSSGAAAHAAVEAARSLPEHMNVVVILPDTGERYLSTDLFGD